MNLQEFAEAMISGDIPEGAACPFFDDMDHMEVSNTEEYFSADYKLLQTYVDNINKVKGQMVVFFNEVENGLDVDKCVEEIQRVTEAANKLEEGKSSE